MSDELADKMLPTAAALACAIDDQDAEEVAAVLTALSRQELYALAVVLAAHVDTNAPMTPFHGPERILRQSTRLAARAFGTTPEAIHGGSRQRHVSEARAVALTVSYHATTLSSTAVAEHFGCDHTTVLYAVGRVGESARLRSIAASVKAQLGIMRPADEEVA